MLWAGPTGGTTHPRDPQRIHGLRAVPSPAARQRSRRGPCRGPGERGGWGFAPGCEPGRVRWAAHGGVGGRLGTQPPGCGKGALCLEGPRAVRMGRFQSFPSKSGGRRSFPSSLPLPEPPGPRGGRFRVDGLRRCFVATDAVSGPRGAPQLTPGVCGMNASPLIPSSFHPEKPHTT